MYVHEIDNILKITNDGVIMRFLSVLMCIFGLHKVATFGNKPTFATANNNNNMVKHRYSYKFFVKPEQLNYITGKKSNSILYVT